MPKIIVVLPSTPGVMPVKSPAFCVFSCWSARVPFGTCVPVKMPVLQEQREEEYQQRIQETETRNNYGLRVSDGFAVNANIACHPDVLG